MMVTIPAIRTTQEQVSELVLELLPHQGEWGDEQYLWLTDHTNRLVEFTDGFIEIPPMPTEKHQAISQYLFLAFLATVQRIGGRIHYAPLRLRVREGKYREPDLVLVRDARDRHRGNQFWSGTDVVVEVASPDKPERELIEKCRDYAEAGVPEYWIAKPFNETITVLRLEDDVYVEHGSFGRGARDTSALLTGFAVEVSAVFDAD